MVIPFLPFPDPAEGLGSVEIKQVWVKAIGKKKHFLIAISAVGM